MDKTKKMALKVTKEIIVKFIEVGRISPTNFGEHFKNIYKEVLDTIEEGIMEEDKLLEDEED